MLNLVFNSNVEKISWDREKRVKQKENKEEEDFIFECDSNEKKNRTIQKLYICEYCLRYFLNNKNYHQHIVNENFS